MTDTAARKYECVRSLKTTSLNFGPVTILADPRKLRSFAHFFGSQDMHLSAFNPSDPSHHHRHRLPSLAPVISPATNGAHQQITHIITMSLLRTAVARPLRVTAALPARTAIAGPSNSINLLCRSFASTSLASADKPTFKSSSSTPASSAASTYTAILDSLTDSYEKTTRGSGRLSRPADGRRGYVEDLEAEWASRSVYGEQSWPATPFSGRSIRVSQQADASRAYAQLSVLLRRNNVRQELRLQQRYEKPNEERRRKKSERHRRRFADMVRRKVQLVMAIKARGA